MKIFLAEFDLFHKIGGGQTFYRNIITKNPHLQFYYLTIEEKINGQRPANAHIFPYYQRYIKSDLKKIGNNLPLEKITRPFLLASNIAYSIRHQNFDIIDCPDYEQYGLFLRDACDHHQVKYQKLALSLHGVVSQSLIHDWVIDKNYINSLEFAENLQYQIVDIRYGISKNYLEFWQDKYDFLNYYYHPLNFINLPHKKIKNYHDVTQKPILNFIGRKEKNKGADIFVNLLTFLEKKLYSYGNIIGADSPTLDGKTGEYYLQQMLKLRNSNINVIPSLTTQQLNQKFSKNSVTILPSRFDTLNFVALESLLNGCPTIISDKAGICRFLKDNFPQLPFISIDINNFSESLNKISQLLINYNQSRNSLIKQVNNISFNLEQLGLKLTDIYYQENNYSSQERKKVNEYYQQLINHCYKKQYWQKETIVSLSKKILNPLNHQNQVLIKTVKNKIITQKKPIHTQLIKSLFFSSEFNKINDLPEISARDIDDKLTQLKNLSHPLNISMENRQKWRTGYFVNRVKIWQEIARLEKLRGNNLLSACYEARIIRSLNQDKFQQLQFITETFNNHNLNQEAEVINLLYQPSKNNSKLCHQYLLNNYQKHLNYQEKPYEFIEDYRQKKNYRVSIAVSLYNAENKLGFFLSILIQQSLFQKQEAEIILIDSASPQNEYQLFQTLLPQLKHQNIPIVYARSEKRETIQSAWNRAILLSQSPYITFLGVDEMITCDGLEKLAAKLDSNPELDWVIGNSLVTEVDYQGNWRQDVMTYSRTKFNQNLVYLDTCYLTYVGGLYRKNIHKKFGFYDETFRGAGDTEFKNRVLPYIKTSLVEDVWGIFWNYPDERTTQNYFTELEDLRAWYVYRSLGGIEYGFREKNLEDIENLLLLCLNYRKSFLETHSTDFDLAWHIIQYLEQNYPKSKYLSIKKNIDIIQQTLVSLELVNNKKNTDNILFLCLYRGIEKYKKQSKTFKKYLDFDFKDIYLLFNDNRYEQHFYSW
ncbi:glycosyltransferase [Cyanobacterium aponinum AL20118]|uniref:Glycosyltransferase n=1 Tax=Cyanobacterium aponinum AL20115 TaxID=3090662 RepID=A0AAF0ZCG8_9CHRO|nr:glycosyltransferase [Cyanobacterium aponinum]WPF87447.1 glycosyltransferase [Cyanobacterium aponinum AL20115]